MANLLCLKWGFLFVCFSVFYPVTIDTQEADARIVGGQPTDISRAPFLVSLRANGRFICGGSLVAPRYVVTAAHCVRGRRRGDLRVKGGATNLNGQGVSRNVARIMIPSGYRQKTKHMDVAVLKLAGPINSGTVPLCESNMNVGARVQVFGWGILQEGDKSNSNHVQMVTVPILNKSRCRKQYRKKGSKVTNTMFCAAGRGRDACAGDSGGPAILNGQLCGIVSWGAGCARSNFPGVYTNVNFVRAFINRAMKNM